MGQNRREKKRVPTRGCRVDITRRGKLLFSKQISYDRIMVDLSEGGLKFIHPEKLRVGVTVRLTIHPPHTFVPVEMKGRIAWVRPEKRNGSKARFATGVKFGRVGSREKGQLRSVMDSLRGYFEAPSRIEAAVDKKRI